MAYDSRGGLSWWQARKLKHWAQQSRRNIALGQGHACNSVLKARNIKCSMRSFLTHAWGYKRSQQSHFMCTEVQCGYGRPRSGAQVLHKWDGSQNHTFIISGRSNSDYAKESKDRHSVSGHMVYLEGAYVQEQPREDSVIVHYWGRDICRSYLHARHAPYEECPRVIWT